MKIAPYNLKSKRDLNNKIYYLKMDENESSSEDVEEDNQDREVLSEIEDRFEGDLDMAKSVYDRLKNYIEFNGLDFLNISEEKSVTGLLHLL